MERRAAVGLLAAGAGACAIRSSALKAFTGPVERRLPFTLPPVQVSPDRVIGTLVGLRPYRRSGFVVRAEKLDSKLVVQNYGHGGGGITLSWGSAQLATELALQSEHRRCAVLGCGVMGLSTAILLRRHGCDVTIYTRDLPPDTTSNIAGGQWTPWSVYDEGHLTPAFNEQFKRAARVSYGMFRELVGDQYGVRWIDNYTTQDQPIQLPRFFDDLNDLFPGASQLGPDLHPFPRRFAHRYTSMQIQTPVYMRAIERDFRLAGGRIVVRDFRDAREIQDLQEPLVVNCTGLGARSLFADPELVPAKGQLTLLLPQPEVKYIVGADVTLYMHARPDTIILGGTFERNQWHLTPSDTEMQRMLREHARFFGAMRPAAA